MNGCAPRGSAHRCGECGDEPTYAVCDLEVLAEEFEESGWPERTVDAFLDWLKARRDWLFLPAPPALLPTHTDMEVNVLEESDGDDDEMDPGVDPVLV